MFVCFGLIHPPEAAHSGGLCFMGVLLLFENHHERESNEALQESEEGSVDAKIELGPIIDVGLGRGDQCLDAPHHGLLEDEPVADDLATRTLVSEGSD